MIIGFSEETLYNSIARQVGEIQSELDWLKHYRREKDVECMEDCVRNIADSLTAVKENIGYLKEKKVVKRG